MTDLNSVMLVGRICADGDLQFLSTGTAKMTVRLASNRSEKKNGEWTNVPLFMDVVIWGKYAESLKGKIEKGAVLGVCGSLRQDTWTSPEGEKKSKIYIVADSVELFGKSGGKSEKTEEKPHAVQVMQEVFGEQAFKEDVPF